MEYAEGGSLYNGECFNHSEEMQRKSFLYSVNLVEELKSGQSIQFRKKKKGALLQV